jgi:hypothetical protein
MKLTITTTFKKMTERDEQLYLAVWRRLENAESSPTTFYLKFINDDNSYSVLISDLISVWEAHFDQDQIKHDIERFCPQISMAIPNLITHIRSCLTNENKEPYSIKIAQNNGELQVLIDTTLLLQALGTIPFQWRLDCKPVGSATYQNSQNSQKGNSKKRRRGNDRQTILIEDDEEITDHLQQSLEEKLQQAQVLRQHVVSPLLGYVAFPNL